MADNLEFRHLSLYVSRQGKPKLWGGGSRAARTTQNCNNRLGHGTYIKNRVSELSHFWKERRIYNANRDMPYITTGIPILLEIDPNVDIDFLRGLGFEIVCDIEEGFIIVATDDVDITILKQKTDLFMANVTARCNSPANVYALCEDENRLQKILSRELYSKWNTLDDLKDYMIDIGVSCCGNIKLPEKPKRQDAEEEDHYNLREENWREKFERAYMDWDNIKLEREGAIEEFVSAYGGEIFPFVDGESSFANLPDSFSARLKISGKCLRDLVLNFAYIFEVSESEKISMGVNDEINSVVESNVTILAPENEDPIVCVIDSGIQEKHRYLSSAICSQDSICLLPNETDVSDRVCGGGHGTRVAGAILYPKDIPIAGEYKLPCWIRNVRILDNNNCMPLTLFPPNVISKVVNDFSGNCQNPTKLFNHSVGWRKSCDLMHMSPWAAEIDLQSYEHDILFIQAAGNISPDIISAYMLAGYPYPEYLDRELSRICNPAQSLQALTIGSVVLANYETLDSIALGAKDEVSSFSRSGPGIWDVIKPDVVEYGGTDVKDKISSSLSNIKPEEVCPELIRKSPEGPAFARDVVGTSFSTPKVTYIAAEIEKIFPEAPALLYRALIAQSARWPEGYLANIDADRRLGLLRRIGYGIPNLARATHNNDYRITLITPSLLEISEGEANIFKIPIPDELRSVGEDYDILVEITLSYAAKPRRTRRYLKNYLSTWIDWCCSRIGEDPEIFSRRILETGGSIEDDGDFHWMLGEATNRGEIDGFSRKQGTLQKDWCIISSNQLRDAFCIAVRGHKGWGGMFKAKYSLVVSFEAINQDIVIYEPIRTVVEVELENGEIEVEMRDTTTE